MQLAAAVEPWHRDNASVSVSVARALPFSAGVTTTTLSQPAAEAVAQEKDPNRSSRTGLTLRLGRVEGAPLGRVEDLNVGRGVPAGRTAPAAEGLCERAQLPLPRDAGEKGWKEGLLGYGARVLALSVSSSK